MIADKDDFLILGFTGPFSGGCTTAAFFFYRQLMEKKSQVISQKDAISAEIANFYRDLIGERGKADVKSNKKDLVKLVRKRQIINALAEVEPATFYYISMTDMLNSLLVKDCLAPRVSVDTLSADYIDLKNRVVTIAEQVGITPENACEIRAIEEDRSAVEATKVFEYYKKISLFRNEFHKSYGSDFSKFIGIMQSVGNNLRRSGQALSSDPIQTDKFLSILSHEAGTLLRITRDWHKNENPKDTRTHFLIECFRNPKEIDYFRRRYNEFFLFAIYSDEQCRQERARRRYNVSADQCQTIDERDQGDDFVGEPYAQNVSKCVQLADIAVTNQKQLQDFYYELLKYYALIKKPGCIKPTHSERNMNLAYSMSLNSTCICRQVGAVIIDDGFVVGAGWNDTERERLGCMYRLRRDVEATDNESFPLCSDEDYETFSEIILAETENPDFSFCYKDEFGKLKEEKLKHRKADEADLQKINLAALARSLQQCRALHAEESAILQTSRMGGQGLKNATLYTTTFPCELCAKKILQVGIRRVFYCEPYPKSVSKDVFFKEGLAEIIIRPFEGVKSPSFFRLFKPSLDIKDQQKLKQMVQSQNIPDPQHPCEITGRQSSEG